MREVTKQLIKDFKLYKLGYDFAGYKLIKSRLSFHHFLISKKECLELGLGEGMFYNNGVVLNQTNSHDYIHCIERIQPEIFYAITSEFLDMHNKGYLDVYNLKEISYLMKQFEKSQKGKIHIKKEYLRREF